MLRFVLRTPYDLGSTFLFGPERAGGRGRGTMEGLVDWSQKMAPHGSGPQKSRCH